MSSVSELLTEGNTNVFAHRIAGDSLVCEYLNYEFGEVLVTEPVESGDAWYLDRGTCHRLSTETVT